MSEITAVPLRPIRKGSLTMLWAGVGTAVLIAGGVAWSGTAKQVALGTPPTKFLAQNAKRPGVHVTPSGLEYKVLKPGNGSTATASDVVLLDYEGKLADGSSFDASARYGGPQPMAVSGSIPGFSEGLQLMNRGATYRFWIPPELAYGPEGAGGGKIPPNALLVFDVTVHEIISQAQAQGMMGAGGAR